MVREFAAEYTIFIYLGRPIRMKL